MIGKELVKGARERECFDGITRIGAALYRRCTRAGLGDPDRQMSSLRGVDNLTSGGRREGVANRSSAGAHGHPVPPLPAILGKRSRMISR